MLIPEIEQLELYSNIWVVSAWPTIEREVIECQYHGINKYNSIDYRRILKDENTYAEMGVMESSSPDLVFLTELAANVFILEGKANWLEQVLALDEQQLVLHKQAVRDGKMIIKRSKQRLRKTVKELRALKSK